jgi:hypothetical protein
MLLAAVDPEVTPEPETVISLEPPSDAKQDVDSSWQLDQYDEHTALFAKEVGA